MCLSSVTVGHILNYILTECRMYKWYYVKYKEELLHLQEYSFSDMDGV